jgi:hypothetical protein
MAFTVGGVPAGGALVVVTLATEEFAPCGGVAARTRK